MMKNFSVNGMGFQVDEDWLDQVRIKVSGNVGEQVYMAAMSDPERSGIVMDDSSYGKSIENMKALVSRAKDINREKNSDIRILMEQPDVYTVRFAGQEYASGLNLKEVNHALDKIKAYLDHDNLVKVRIFTASGKSDLQRAMDLEAFMNNKCYKVISLSDDGQKYTLCYIAKNYHVDSDEE